MASSLSSLPNEAVLPILGYLSATDLCHVALCNRSWREAANQNALWRPLCRDMGWEHFGTTTDLCEEPPFVPASSPEQHGTDASTSVTFPMEIIVTDSDWPHLTGTCKWKEVYMKARHLENNWRSNRYHVFSLDFGSAGFMPYWGEVVEGSGEALFLHNLDGDGDILVAGVSDETLHVWDLASGNRQHLIQVGGADKLEEARPKHFDRHYMKINQALKVKNGIIAVGCKDGKIRTYSTQTGGLLQVMSGHRLAVSRLFFDGETIVSTAPVLRGWKCERKFEDSDIRVWTAKDGSCRCVFKSTSRDICLVDFDFKGQTVAGAYSNQTIRLWDAKDGSCKLTISTGDTKLLSCRLGDGFFISFSENNVIKRWDVTGEFHTSFVFDRKDLKGYIDTDQAVDISLSKDFLLTQSWPEMNVKMFSLDGKYIGQTKSTNTDYYLEFVYFHRKRLVTNDSSGGLNYLWALDQQNGFSFVKELRGMLHDDEAESEFSAAWMSDTKLAFLVYFEERFGVEQNRDTPQVPKIVVHHYW